MLVGTSVMLFLVTLLGCLLLSRLLFVLHLSQLLDLLGGLRSLLFLRRLAWSRSVHRRECLRLLLPLFNLMSLGLEQFTRHLVLFEHRGLGLLLAALAAEFHRFRYQRV